MNVIENIKKIRLEKGVTQLDIALALDFKESNWNKIENGKQFLKVNHLAKIADVLGVSVVDLFTYPKKYVDSSIIQKPERISVTFEVSPDKRDILLKLVTDNDNIKLFDK